MTPFRHGPWSPAPAPRSRPPQGAPTSRPMRNLQSGGSARARTHGCADAAPRCAGATDASSSFASAWGTPARVGAWSWSGPRGRRDGAFEIRAGILEIRARLDGTQPHVPRGFKRLEVGRDAGLAEAIRIVRHALHVR